MAIGGDFVGDLIRLKEAGHLDGRRSVIELGEQQLGATFFEKRDVLDRLYGLVGMSNPFSGYAPPPSKQVGGVKVLDTTAPYARAFWESLGFEYDAVDVVGTGETIKLDLNFDSVPPESRNHYDIATNFGTTEHVCNQLNAFKVMHDFVKPGGFMYHMLPCSGMLTHGLVNYNPKFFTLLAEANGYELMLIDVLPSNVPYEMPKEIVDLVKPHARYLGWKDSFMIDDVAIKVLFRKAGAGEFAPPVDASKEALRSDAVSAARYGMPKRTPLIDRLKKAFRA